MPMKDRKTAPPPQLKPRDLQVVEFVARYRLATVEALRRAVLPDLSANAIAKLVNRLDALDLLRKYTLCHPVRYFVLGEAGAKAVGRRFKRTWALGPQSLPIEYAVLSYCTNRYPPRRRLTVQEVRAGWPWLPAVSAAAPHALDGSSPTLELLRVDLGGPADHVARKCARDVNARRRFAEFAALVATGRFRLVVITATPEKAAAVRQALDRHVWPSGLRIHASVLPQLLPFTARGRNA